MINTSTTVITFWMVFVIQNSQGRDARAIHLKLDEIIRASEAARNEFIVAEEETEAEVAERQSEMRAAGKGTIESPPAARRPRRTTHSVTRAQGPRAPAISISVAHSGGA